MPYSSPSDAPSYVPKKHRAQWVAVWNSAYERAKKDGKSDKDAESSAFAQANSVAGPNSGKAFLTLLLKAKTDQARAFADQIIAAIEKSWSELPALVRPSLEAARLSGVGKGMLEIDVSNSKLLGDVNTSARQYAAERAAEMIGMKHDADGNLVPNPDARWAISETTRDRIRGIVMAAFTKEVSIEELADEIEQALAAEAVAGGIFSPERARLIAETEVANAQNGGNYSVWEGSGVVTHLRWLTSEDEKVCEVCDGNDNVVVGMGERFPSGDKYPGAHPRCRCLLVVETVT